ncbi:hypothetical protein [uncultured Microbacterium sp.]|uniref:hypothetical protein n=1 Tax=uncultured Microbacterium sp. TaxID=191216 RepID=UPI0028DB6E76|nr:hypothetical protein [uncultured Microbacterium sp.]
MAVGYAVGTFLGMTAGMLFDNLAAGMVFGGLAGVGLGAAFDATLRRRADARSSGGSDGTGAPGTPPR